MMNVDELIENEIKKNPPLRKVFEEHPERKELYKQKILDSENENSGFLTINPKYCKSCIFSHGVPPFEDSPLKACCKIYSRASGLSKPKSVYYDGAKCDYYHKEDSE